MKKKLLIIACGLAASYGYSQYSSPTATVGAIGMTVKVQTTPAFVTLTVTGPSNSFLGVGASFSGNGMEAGADGFIYNSAATLDYTFHGIGVTPTADPVQDWAVLSNTTSGSTRTVVARRSLAGGPGDIPVPNGPGNIELFCARGDGTMVLSYHGPNNREYVTLPMAFDPSLGTAENAPNQEFSVFPNPTNGKLQFSHPQDIRGIKLYDRTGRLVLETKLKGDTLDLNETAVGTYYLEIELDSGQKMYETIIRK
ncbi:T9SS type A sorting domain-containing protein [Kaistella sp. PBT33-4]|uniref:T9SS type A sorting domain-containing protein n=1 Tax=Kaistella sp. PBT33-4 TaxID=3032000 RepID=UPI0023D8C1FD|nr:T9SS type A sorting domain-containing protein [Kaistella sp. PBT33-4]MDF0720938.1 T9SS type A sorting domain-containing protein [Kaistella sp. PBT33-4]